MALGVEYLAGLFDGEGCVNITVRGKSKQVVLRVSIVNTDEGIIELLRAQFGGQHFKSDHRPNWKTFRSWTITGPRAGEFLKTIAPHVIIKRKQVELGIRFAEFMALPRTERCTLVTAPTESAPFRTKVVRSLETLATEIGFKNQMHVLNKKGR